MTPDQAYSRVRTAIKNGLLARPSSCSRCGEPDKKPITGVHSIQGHHYKGYDYPLDVEWLCPKCHRVETPLPEVIGAPNYGEENGYSRLTAAQAREIKNAPEGCRILARRYGVNKSTIQRVRNSRTWRNVTGQESAL